MTDLKAPVLATLVYYDALGLPLTLEEVWKYLINPARLSKLPEGIGQITSERVELTLQKLLNEGTVIREDTFYRLSHRKEIVAERVYKNKMAKEKWRKFLPLVRWLVAAPYLRGLFASGSLALNNTDDESDFDVLVIAKDGRLYTTRFFLWLIASLMFARRKPHQISAPDKLCFNHFISDGRLLIPHESLYNAQTYINLKPVILYEDVFDKFYGANSWISIYAYNFKADRGNLKIKPHKFFHTISQIGERILDSSFGDWLEAKLKSYQQRRIAANPMTHEPGGRIVFDDHELEFHPRSFETTILARYKEGIAHLGINPIIEEKDSGLTRRID